MKRLTLSIIILNVLLSTALFSQSQILVNKVWEESFGQPNEYDWAASTIDINGDLITVGHSMISQNSTKLTIEKRQVSGTAIWEANYEATPNTKNYGTAITSDDFGNIYVAGVNNVDGSIGKNDFLLLKYDVNGNVVWNKLIDGSGQGDDIPVDIILDDFGFIYITGVSLGNGSEMDYFTLKLHPTNGSTIWQKRYDYNNLYDIPVDISIDQSGNILVTGTSAASLTNWEIAVVKYAPTGTLLNEERFGNVSNGFDQPSALAKDANGNLFITGTTTTDGVSFDIKTLKLDSDLNLLWSTTFDGGMVDSVSAIQIDSYGNATLTGWQSNEDGGSDFLTLQYNSNGNLNWSRIRTAPLTTTKAKSKSLAIDNNDNVIITGELREGGKSEMIVNQYDNSGVGKWSVKLSHPNAILNVPIGLNINDEGEIFLTSISKEEFNNNYTTYKLSTLTRNLDAILDSEENPSYLSDEIVIRFKPDIIDTSFIDNKAIRFSRISEIIDDLNIIQEFENQLSVSDFEEWNVIKIHPNLTANNTTTTTRLGKVIQMPDFYNTLVIKIPRESGLDVKNAVNRLNSGNLSCYIRYAEINPVVSLDDCDPDDTLYPTQGNLQATATYPNGHINMEPGWCIVEDASPDLTNLKIAVIDSGVRWSHEDFGNGTFAGSVITDGKDYETGADISGNNENDVTDHGTRVASVIGSIRNNATGVAGIAGGSGAMDGVQIIAQRALYNNTVPATTLIEALQDSHEDFEADLVNVSGGYNSLSEMDNFAMREAVHHLNRMGIIVSGSRGNGEVSTPRLPGTIQDEWVICVGGTNTEGNYNPECRFGEPIDIAAPSRWQLTRTAQNADPGTGIPGDDAYGGISLSSGATPHATGLGALLVGYSSTSLVQEDVEYILQETATDVITPPAGPDYDERTGFGRLNAGAALELIEAPGCQVFHFGTDTDFHSRDIEMVEEGIEIELTEPFTTESGQTFDKGTYTADVYHVEVVVFHSLPLAYNLAHSWERHSSSTVFKNHTANQLQPLENVKFVGAPTEAEATLEGYVYYLKNGNCTIEGWIPASPDDAELTYSLIGCMLTNTSDIGSETFKVFPNPAHDQLTVSHQNLGEFQSVSISIYDFSGKELMIIREIDLIGQERDIHLDIEQLPSGIYTCVIRSEGQIITEKFTKF